MSVFRTPQGDVRNGWVLLTFSSVAGVLLVALSTVVQVLGLSRAQQLDDWSIAWLTMPSLVAASTATLVCRVAFRSTAGFDDPHWQRHAAWGALGGALLLATAVAVPSLLGFTELRLSTLPASALLVSGVKQFVVLAPAGLGEELLLRGVALRVLSAMLSFGRVKGAAVAVLLTGLVFGLMHLMNPHATAWAALNVALVGCLFGALAVVTKSLWCSISLHLSWNFCEGFVFGQPVSGLTTGASLFEAGPNSAVSAFWHGGAFGPEAAGWTGVVLLVALAWVTSKQILM